MQDTTPTSPISSSTNMYNSLNDVTVFDVQKTLLNRIDTLENTLRNILHITKYTDTILLSNQTFTDNTTCAQQYNTTTNICRKVCSTPFEKGKRYLTSFLINNVNTNNCIDAAIVLVGSKNSDIIAHNVVDFPTQGLSKYHTNKTGVGLTNKIGNVCSPLLQVGNILDIFIDLTDVSYAKFSIRGTNESTTCKLDSEQSVHYMHISINRTGELTFVNTNQTILLENMINDIEASIDTSL